MRSLRSRLIVWLIVGITLFLASSGFAIHAIVSSQMRRSFDRSLLTTARSLEPVLRREVGRMVGHAPASAFPQESLASARPDLLFELRYPDGDVLVHSDAFEGQSLPALARGALPMSFINGEARDLRYSDVTLPPDGRSGRALAFVLGRPGRSGRPDRLDRFDRFDRPERLGMPRGARPGEGRMDGPRDRPPRPAAGPRAIDGEGIEVVLAGDTTELFDSLRSLRMLLLLAWISCSVGCAAILSWVVHRSLRPLGRLSRQIEGLGGDGLQKRFVLPDAPAELEPVVAELNLLLARIQDAFDREQAFTADAAHELRTPLAGLRSTLELALSRERSSSDYRRSAQDSLAITEEMQALVGDMLTLSRMASTQIEARRDATSLVESLTEACGPYMESARRRALTLETDVDAELVLSTDPALLERVLRNLIENAVSYADEGSTVEFRATEQGDHLQLDVTNLVSDAPSDLGQKAFLAFWRADSSRSMLDQHAGLGLSLCRRIVHQLGGSIDGHLDGARFSVRLCLPRAPGGS
ncbi:MAG: two-component system heavy metal sensor histidine kinase CusS [Chlamydiales bacterium]|jgi:two-component system heavy metal sensor histidine kinase CusS